MKVNGTHHRTIWRHPKKQDTICVIDQRALPHRFIVEEISTIGQMAVAIHDMHVRGAPLIGASAAWGMVLSAQSAINAGPNWLAVLERDAEVLRITRPTAVNLAWAVDRQLSLARTAQDARTALALLSDQAAAICDEDVAACCAIGGHGLSLIREIANRKPGRPVNILTHCNAGWLACVDHGTATAPIYAAHDAGIPVHVWVDETRPRNQGAKLTAWELGQHGVPHTLIADNSGGHLMQQGLVDICITGADRVARNGDAANKIGTYLKALAAYDNGIPFVVALPSSTIDWDCREGRAIPIENRDAGEVRTMDGLTPDGALATVLICPPSTPALNCAFDVTPARLITHLITERGIHKADEHSLRSAFPG